MIIERPCKGDIVAGQQHIYSWATRLGVAVAGLAVLLVATVLVAWWSVE